MDCGGKPPVSGCNTCCKGLDFQPQNPWVRSSSYWILLGPDFLFLDPNSCYYSWTRILASLAPEFLRYSWSGILAADEPTRWISRASPVISRALPVPKGSPRPPMTSGSLPSCGLSGNLFRTAKAGFQLGQLSIHLPRELQESSPGETNRSFQQVAGFSRGPTPNLLHTTPRTNFPQLETYRLPISGLFGSWLSPTMSRFSENFRFRGFPLDPKLLKYF
jgi:hypothetical protein